MSKAFDTVNRKQLMSDLQNTLQPDELYLLSILTNRPHLSVTVDGDTDDLLLVPLLEKLPLIRKKTHLILP